MKVVAVAIGNNNYYDPDKLKNAVNDAQAMENVFRRLGYTVIPKYNCKNRDDEEVMRTFDNELAQNDASIFFYAGHGFQDGGENYLPSIECQISMADKYALDHNSLRLAELLELYKKHERKPHIVILDACRTSLKRGGESSFAPVDAPPGTLIAFSTSPNSSADDKKGGDHSLYTKALLNYIGRERMTVEELFKKVRRTVAQWSNNDQIPWEHTSLIDDFYFNLGQMVASPQIPYKENVVRDAEYNETGEIADLINEIRSCNYNRQNPAIDKLWSKRTIDLDKNQQFIFGRNLLQASDMSFSAQRFMQSLSMNLQRYITSDGDNHVFNGILFEIYFDSHGDVREKIKRQSFEEVMALRNNPAYAKSFNFIRTVINPYRESLIYTIPEDDRKLDVNITAREEKTNNIIGEEEIYSVISIISVNGKDITDDVRREYRWASNLIETIAICTHAPLDAVELHPNVALQGRISFENSDDPFESLL